MITSNNDSDDDNNKADNIKKSDMGEIDISSSNTGNIYLTTRFSLKKKKKDEKIKWTKISKQIDRYINKQIKGEVYRSPDKMIDLKKINI